MSIFQDIKRKTSAIFKPRQSQHSDLHNSPQPHSSDSFEGAPVQHSPIILGRSGSSDPQSILAFRSITTLLSVLQKPGCINLTPSHSLPQDVRQELKILAALACILVRKNEVVSVVALEPHGQHDSRNLVCSVDNEERPEQMGDDTTTKNTFWSILSTRNFRRESDKSNGSLGVRSQDTPIVPLVDSDKVDHSSESLQNSYITWNAYVQSIEHF